ncbi:MAG: hypothetical protein JNL70_18210 [Saprospiraceae bacterium]|nr:hypothetical protein [Saprospiraceae bacterium]
MKYCLPFAFLLFAQSIFGQTKLPIIKATTKTVAIKDDTFLDKEAWFLTPEAKPDIYKADRTRKTKWVTFYTDVDSIKVKVKPGTIYDFIILLNNKDTCYTRIVSAISAENSAKITENRHDTIPFTLTAYNAIHVKAIFNKRDTLNMHLDLGAFDFKLTQEAIVKKTQLLASQPDAIAGKAKPNFNKMEKVNTIQIGSLTWQNPVFAATGFTAREMDGRIGYNVFEGKIIEIDYDKNLLIIHSKLPRISKGYIKSEVAFLRSFPCINGSISIKNNVCKGDFLLDTGADMAMLIDSIWAEKQGFPKDLPLLKVTSFKNPRGVVFEQKTVVSPLLNIQNSSFVDVPTTLLGANNPAGISVNFLGNDVLKRFNTILDLQKDYIYLKPNKLFSLPFKEKKG